MAQSGEAYEEAIGKNNNFVTIMVGSIITHLVFGVTLGLVSSLLSVRFGSRYRCSICDISFSRIDSYQKHVEFVHGAKPIQQKHILILGGGFGGIKVLTQLQRAFQNDVSIHITLVSRDNFFLFTPMLPEVASGMIETRNIVTPVRAFCNRAKFYEANICKDMQRSLRFYCSFSITANPTTLTLTTSSFKILKARSVCTYTIPYFSNISLRFFR
jgi:Pyridine nucleotide-disulphide oxidoreductase